MAQSDWSVHLHMKLRSLRKLCRKRIRLSLYSNLSQLWLLHFTDYKEWNPVLKTTESAFGLLRCWVQLQYHLQLSRQQHRTLRICKWLCILDLKSWTMGSRSEFGHSSASQSRHCSSLNLPTLCTQRSVCRTLESRLYLWSNWASEESGSCSGIWRFRSDWCLLYSVWLVHKSKSSHQSHQPQSCLRKCLRWNHSSLLHRR